MTTSETAPQTASQVAEEQSAENASTAGLRVVDFPSLGGSLLEAVTVLLLVPGGSGEETATEAVVSSFAAAADPRGRGASDDHAGRGDNLPGKLAQKQLKLKQKAIEHISRTDMKIVFVPTIVKGLSEFDPDGKTQQTLCNPLAGPFFF